MKKNKLGSGCIKEEERDRGRDVPVQDGTFLCGRLGSTFFGAGAVLFCVRDAEAGAPHYGMMNEFIFFQ